MAGWRRAVELAMTGEEIERLTALSRSRTEPASRVSRADAAGLSRESFVLCGGGGGFRRKVVINNVLSVNAAPAALPRDMQQGFVDA
jgi:hypothetical protein